MERIMSALVVLKLCNIIATLMLGLKFKAQESVIMKNFGYALLLNGLAFITWSSAVVLRPESLDVYITVGALFFAISLVFFLLAGTQKNANNKSVVIMGVVAITIFFIFRVVVWPSNPEFTESGMLLFNINPIIQMMYIFGLGLVIIPAIYAISKQFNSVGTSLIVRYGFIVQVMGGLVLITSTDQTVLFVNGLVISITYILLWMYLLLNRAAWN
jgi:hypothetical protein